MKFTVRVIDDDDFMIFESSNISLDKFNKYFIDSCRINVNGEYEMHINNYRHAINNIYEAVS